MSSSLLTSESVGTSSRSDYFLTLSAVCEAAVKLMGVDHSGLVLFEANRQRGKVVAEYPAGSQSAVGSWVPISGVAPAELLVQQGKPIVSNDVQSDTSLGDTRRILRGFGIVSIVIVPITVDDQVIGSFSFDAIKQRREFEESDIKKCSSLAVFASLVVKHADKVNTLEPLRDAMLAIASAQEREPLLNAITVQAVNLLRADSGGIDELDPIRQELSVVAAHNLPPEIIGQKLRVGWGIAGQLINSSLDHMVESNYPEWDFRANYENVNSLESVIGVPLISDTQRTGVLWVNASRPREYDQNDIETLKSLAAPASIALEQSRSREKERNRAKSLEKLASATFDILSHLTTSDQKQRLTLIAKHAHRIMDAEACGILLVEEPDWLSLVASHGHREGGFEEGRRFEIVTGKGTGLTGHIASQGAVFRECGTALTDHHAVKDRKSDHSPSGECFSLLAIPLAREDGELIGLLRISNKRDKDGAPNEWTCFSEDDQWVGEIFAQAAMIAIETADLFDKVKQGENRYKTVVDACKVLAQARMPENGLRALAELVVELSRKCFCGIALFREADNTLEVIAAAKRKGREAFNWNPRLGESIKIGEWPNLDDALKSGEPIVLTGENDLANNLHRLGDWLNLRDGKDNERLDIKSMLAIPLKVESRTIGLLNVSSVSTPPHFDDTEISRAVAVSEQVSLLIERMDREKKLLRNFFETERQIIALNDLKRVLRLIANRVYDVAHEWGRQVTVVDINLQSGNGVQVVAAFPADKLASIRTIVNKDYDLNVGIGGRIGIVGKVIKSGNSIIAPDVKLDQNYFEIHPNTRSQLVAPIKDGSGKTIGAISAESSELDAFDKQDLMLVEGFANQASLAIAQDQQSRENKKARIIALLGAAGSGWDHAIKPRAKYITDTVDEALRQSNLRTIRKRLANYIMDTVGKALGQSNLRTIRKSLESIRDDAKEIYDFTFAPADQDISEELINNIIRERVDWVREIVQRQKLDADISTTLSGTNGRKVLINKVWFQNHILGTCLRNAREALVDADEKRLEVRTEMVGPSNCRILIINSGPKIKDEIWDKLGNDLIVREGGDRNRGRGLLLANFLLPVYGGKLELIANEENNIVIGINLPISMPKIASQNNS
ncbi:MAG: hypothetical protein QOE77_739 [Blastocatellia bacterium]|jgi:GAF domain-containing protein|nr:hypothetical protein [Blastocatellia bacterium]